VIKLRVLIGTATAKVVSELINNGQIRQARERADDRVLNDAWFLIEDANFFYWYGKAVRLTSHDEKLLKKIRMFMQTRENCSRLLNCDWLIDEAIDAIRLFNLDYAVEVISDLVFEMPANSDYYYYAAIHMLKGRIAYLRQDFDQAVDRHFIADVVSLNEYRVDNLLYLLKASSAKGMNHVYRNQIANRIIDGDTRRLRQFRAKLISSCRLGNTIDDILMRLGFV